MKEYRVTATIQLFTGEIGLRDEQAIPRRENLKAGDRPGIYRIIRPIEFKRGELILLKEVDKVTLEDLEEVSLVSTMDDSVPVVAPKKTRGKKTK